MIAQLKHTLLQNALFEKKNVDEKPITEKSINDRLKSLTNSANIWQQRVPKPTMVTRANHKGSTKQFAGSTYDNNRQMHEKPVDLSKGLNKFFSAPTTSKIHYDPENVDFEAICSTALPALKAPSRPRVPSRKKSTMTRKDERVCLSTVQLNRNEFDVEEAEPEKLETQEAAIAALVSAKQQLKNAVKKSPYPKLMLIQVRGTKNVDVRLVAPSMSSIHENASFIMVDAKNLVKYEGLNSNIMEKTKATQLCIEIVGKSDLNCCAQVPITLTRDRRDELSKWLDSNVENEENNNRMMGSYESEPFECTAANLNLVFRVDEETQTAQIYSRKERLSVKMLQPNETFIFDFGSEIYVWTGRNSKKLTNAYALEYAKQLLEKPVNNASNIIGNISNCENRRPSWTLFRKIYQGVLDTLFKAKFYDWNDKEILTTCRPTPLISAEKKRKVPKLVSSSSNNCDDVERLSNRLMSEKPLEPIMTLEDQEINREMQDIVSESLQLWVLSGEVLKPIEFSAVFYSNCCYVLRWQYRVQKSGVRRLRTGKEEERETGRSRIAFFYWLGEQTTPKLHGLCALRIKEIDRDNSPRIRVVDGDEPALFLALFDGKFVVRSSTTDENSSSRLYAVTGANQKETSIREINSQDELRSHAVYIEEKPSDGTIQIICGANSSRCQVKLALTHAAQLKTAAEPSVEVEGDAPHRRWISCQGRRHAMKVWRLFDNEAEQLNHLSAHEESAFSFSPNILSETMMIDVGDCLWLWSEETVTTFALKVCHRYWRGRNGPAMVIRKGNEPKQFQALFMKWLISDNVSNDKDESTNPRELKSLLDERCRFFSVEELRDRTNLPAGMDMRNLESYLSDDDFEQVFKMSRAEFHAMKGWKQNEARKKAGLF